MHLRDPPCFLWDSHRQESDFHSSDYQPERTVDASCLWTSALLWSPVPQGPEFAYRQLVLVSVNTALVPNENRNDFCHLLQCHHFHLHFNNRYQERGKYLAKRFIHSSARQSRATSCKFKILGIFKQIFFGGRQLLVKTLVGLLLNRSFSWISFLLFHCGANVFFECELSQVLALLDLLGNKCVIENTTLDSHIGKELKNNRSL